MHTAQNYVFQHHHGLLDTIVSMPTMNVNRVHNLQRKYSQSMQNNSIESAINKSIVRVTSNQSGTIGKARGTRRSAGTSDIIRRGRPRP